MARALLLEAEAADHYLESCTASPTNRLARKEQIYEPFFLEPIHATRLSRLSKEIPLMANSRMIILHPTADNGFPHTRPGGLVCIPTGVMEKSTDAVKNTLIHEAIHLHQRNYEHSWDIFCRREGWAPVDDTEIPEELQASVRLNPDTLASPFWSWQDYFVPLPLFVPKPQLGLGDIRVKWFDLRNRAIFADPPPSFLNRFGDISQPEHPYEIYAVEFSDAGLDSAGKVLQRMAN